MTLSFTLTHFFSFFFFVRPYVLNLTDTVKFGIHGCPGNFHFKYVENYRGLLYLFAKYIIENFVLLFYNLINF